jgi:hypothetical protein
MSRVPQVEWGNGGLSETPEPGLRWEGSRVLSWLAGGSSSGASRRNGGQPEWWRWVVGGTVGAMGGQVIVRPPSDLTVESVTVRPSPFTLG